MKIVISNNSEIPIYQQIKDQIKEAILKGHLQNGELLPSIRNLANETGVSVLTSKRAYDELEQEGFLHGVQGKGFYVAARNMELLKEEKMREIEKLLSQIMDIAGMIDLKEEELQTLFEIIQQERKN